MNCYEILSRTCVYHTAASLLPSFYLIAIKHAFTLYYKHVNHAVSTLLHLHGIYLYKLASRVSCSLPSLETPLLVHRSQTSKESTASLGITQTGSLSEEAHRNTNTRLSIICSIIRSRNKRLGY